MKRKPEDRDRTDSAGILETPRRNGVSASKGPTTARNERSHGRTELCSRQKTLNSFEFPLANLTSFGSISYPSFNVVHRFRWLAVQAVSHGFDLAHFEVLGPQSFVPRTAQMATSFHAVLVVSLIIPVTAIMIRPSGHRLFIRRSGQESVWYFEAEGRRRKTRSKRDETPRLFFGGIA